MTEQDKRQYNVILDDLRRKFIEAYQNEIGIPAPEDMAFYRELHQAIERGKKLHPGPYIFPEWVEGLREEYHEVIEEIHNRILGHKDNLEAELIDLIVVAARMIKSIKLDKPRRYDP